MLGLDNYGSDDEELSSTSSHVLKSELAHSTSQSLSQHTDSARRSSKKRPVQFSIDLPPSDVGGDELEPHPVKRPRTEASGKSSLFGLLPAAKPLLQKPESEGENMLGAGSGRGLVFRSGPAVATTEEVAKPFSVTKVNDHSLDSTHPNPSSSTSNSTDFFSLGNPSTIRPDKATSQRQNPSLSAAPSVPDFEPPEPSEQDAYPGYYQLPSGQWAQYDSDYYRSYWQEKLVDWEQANGAVDKGFEGAGEQASEISIADQMDEGRKMREEKKALTKNAHVGIEKPNMNIAPPKIGSRARYRHQLSALLTEAFDKREELEERIAQSRRNRKEAGNRYALESRAIGLQLCGKHLEIASLCRVACFADDSERSLSPGRFKSRMLRMLMFGKPGSGKGTLSGRLVDKYNVSFVSCGDILRQNIQDKTEVGKIAESIIATGDLVPDNVITKIVTDRLDLLSEHWILDGYPRTVVQGQMLNKHLGASGNPLSLVVTLDVPDDIILDRIRNRWIHQPSGRIYNMSYNRPKVAGKDDVTSEPLTKRPDDNPDVFARRLKNYYNSTSPLLDYFQSSASGPFKLVTLSGKTSDEIWPKLQHTIEESFPVQRRT